MPGVSPRFFFLKIKLLFVTAENEQTEEKNKPKASIV